MIVDSYVITVEAVRSRGRYRFYWTLCQEGQAEELLAWGNAPTRTVAKALAKAEIERLKSGFSSGGRRTDQNLS